MSLLLQPNLAKFPGGIPPRGIEQLLQSLPSTLTHPLKTVLPNEGVDVPDLIEVPLFCQLAQMHGMTQE